MIMPIKKTQITQILKAITQIRFGQGNGQGNEARIGKGYGNVTVAVTETGIVTFAVAVTKVNLCNQFRFPSLI